MSRLVSARAVLGYLDLLDIRYAMRNIIDNAINGCAVLREKQRAMQRLRKHRQTSTSIS